MKEYLQLLAEKKIKLNLLIEGIYKLKSAPEAYKKLKSSGLKPMIVLLESVTDRVDPR